MRIPTFFLVSLTFLLYSFSLHAQDDNPSKKSGIYLAFEGTFYDEDIATTIKRDNWYGLFYKDGACSVKSVELMHKSENFEGPGGAMTDLFIKDGSQEPLFLIQGLENMESPQESAYANMDSPQRLYPGAALYCNGGYFGAAGSGKTSGYGTTEIEEYELYWLPSVYNDNATKEKVHVLSLDKEDRYGLGYPFMVWAGDIDGDGVPDALIRFEYEMAHGYKLWLSSKKAVVAHFWEYFGC